MLLCINYADEKFKPFQQLQTATARYFGADDVREYSPKDIDADFYAKNKFILDQPRGAGYWIWKPYIIKDALSRVNAGDLVFYVDSGAFYVNKIQYLVDTMNKNNLNIMLFGGDLNIPERVWTKRDAFILMDCDEEKYWNSGQIVGGFVLLRKSPEAENFVDDWLKYVQDPRIVTDQPNQLGVENLPDFKANRHDQSVLGLLAKKKNLPIFRNPAHNVLFGITPPEIIQRSPYPTILYLHRRGVPLGRTLEDFLQIYSGEPKLLEGVRSAKFLLEEGMLKESWELLNRLLAKYGNGNAQLWLMAYGELLEIFDMHRAMGAPYPEMFQPLLCRMFVVTMQKSPQPHQVLRLINVAKFVENKLLIPPEFCDMLRYFVAVCIENSIDVECAPPITIFNEYKKLNLPGPTLEIVPRKSGGGSEFHYAA